MNHTRGFTLIELLVVLAVVAFLAFVTVPLASGWIRNAQLEKDFAGLQRALGTAKAVAMRNSVGVTADDPATAAFENPTAVLCRSDVKLILFRRGVPQAADLASCTRIAATDKPIYSMGQDVAITFGAANQAFCGAQFDARGSVRLCQGANCATCDLTFDPRTAAGALKVIITGADNLNNDPNDQSQLIRAF